MSRRPVVQFDVDGVLANFDLGYRRVYHELFGVTLPPATRWDQSTDPHVWAEIKSSPTFWLLLAPLVDVVELQKIADLYFAADVYFVTHRMGVNPKRQTEQWLELYGIPRPTVVVSGAKGEFAKMAGVTHAIDDKFGNAYVISCLSRGTKSFLLDAPYNQADHTVVGGSVTRVQTVAQFLEEIA